MTGMLLIKKVLCISTPAEAITHWLTCRVNNMFLRLIKLIDHDSRSQLVSKILRQWLANSNDNFFQLCFLKSQKAFEVLCSSLTEYW